MLQERVTGFLAVSIVTRNHDLKGYQALASSAPEARQGPFAPGLDLDSYVGELEGIRSHSEQDLCSSGEQALKTLDLFLSNLAAILGYENERPGMHDSIQYLERLGGRAQSIAAQAERFRATRNALAHNPDLTLRPEAAIRIIESVEKIVRSAAQTAYEMARHPGRFRISVHQRE